VAEWTIAPDCHPTGGHPQGDKSYRAKMNYVYLLKSKVRKWYYIGSTRDLKNQLIEHNNGRVKSTKAYKPFDLIYYEAYPNYH